MVSFYQIACVFLLLLHGVAAKPYKPWNTFVNVALQETIMNEKGEVDWGLQVEPPEDQDVTSYDIDPSMKIWKSVAEAGPDGKYRMAEEDLDELQHPSVVNRVVPINRDIAPNVPGPDEQQRVDVAEEEVRAYLRALVGNIGAPRYMLDDDMDDIYHRENLDSAMQVDDPAPVGSDVMGQPEVRLYSAPEEDVDNIYHADQQLAAQVEVAVPEGSDVMGLREVRLHLEPEEDMDAIYHADDLRSAVRTDIAAPAGSDVIRPPEVRLHLEPEEDMDAIYHADELRSAVRTDIAAPAGSDVIRPPEVRLHLEPEEDMDAIYHADELRSAVRTDIAAPAGSDVIRPPEVRLHLEPEEDMDELYHRDQLMPAGPYQELADTAPGAVRPRGQLVADEYDL